MSAVIPFVALIRPARAEGGCETASAWMLDSGGGAGEVSSRMRASISQPAARPPPSIAALPASSLGGQPEVVLAEGGGHRTAQWMGGPPAVH